MLPNSLFINHPILRRHIVCATYSVLPADDDNDNYYRIYAVTTLWVGRLGNRRHIPCRDEKFALLHNVRTGSAAYPVSYPTDTESQGQSGRVSSWPLASTSIEINNAWTYISSPPYVFTAWYLVKHTHNFISALAIIMRVS